MHHIRPNNRFFADWLAAAFFALVLNAGLFALMPGLLATSPDMGESMTPVYPINVIRMKRPEAPPKKKPEQRPEPDDAQREETLRRAVLKTKPQPRLQLPFEINPRLPQMPGVNPTLFMEKYTSIAPDVYDIGDIDAPITPIAQIPPVYPMRARRLGIEGWVRVDLLVTEQGDVETVEVVDASPKGVFENAVVQCLETWRFSPGTVGGQPVKTRVQTTIRFNLENE